MKQEQNSTNVHFVPRKQNEIITSFILMWEKKSNKEIIVTKRHNKKVLDKNKIILKCILLLYQSIQITYFAQIYITFRFKSNIMMTN